MKRIPLCVAAVIIFYGLAAGTGKEIGKIGAVDSGKKEVTVNVKTGTDIKMGDQLVVETGSGKVILEVLFPMQTLAKCRIKGKGKASGLSKGMTVYRFDKSDAANSGDEGDMLEIELVLVKEGSFTMGSPETEKDRRGDEKQHTVSLSSFYIGKYEVTQKEYIAVTGTNPSSFKGDNLPVEKINWYDAIEFCNRLSEKKGLKPYYEIDKNKKDPDSDSINDNLQYTVKILGGNGYRLPTEAEWEYACRGGTDSAFHYGDQLDSSMANFNGKFPYNADAGVNRGKTTNVGSFEPNGYGLYDMHGNVSEWCWDWYGGYSGKSSDPKGTDRGEFRILRGGSWNSDGSSQRSAFRQGIWAHFSYNYLGFRVVRSAD